MKLIEHPNVLQLYDVYENRKYLYASPFIFLISPFIPIPPNSAHPSFLHSFQNLMTDNKTSDGV